MRVSFPSLEFFQALRGLALEEGERFRRLGFVDTTFGLRVIGPGGRQRCFVLAFEVFECRQAKEVESFSGAATDFIIQGELAAWTDMLANIRRHGRADTDHSLNTLTHFGEKLEIVYDDPDGRDKFFRFQESIQEYFDLSARLDLTFVPAPAEPTAPPR